MRWRICDGTWYVFFFKRKTAYDMRIIDWSSDVCSSDLLPLLEMGGGPRLVVVRPHLTVLGNLDAADRDRQPVAVGLLAGLADRHDDAAPIGIAAGDRRLDQRRVGDGEADTRSEEHTSELQSLMRISYAVFCLKKKKT